LEPIAAMIGICRGRQTVPRAELWAQCMGTMLSSRTRRVTLGSDAQYCISGADKAHENNRGRINGDLWDAFWAQQGKRAAGFDTRKIKSHMEAQDVCHESCPADLRMHWAANFVADSLADLAAERWRVPEQHRLAVGAIDSMASEVLARLCAIDIEAAKVGHLHATTRPAVARRTKPTLEQHEAAMTEAIIQSEHRISVLEAVSSTRLHCKGCKGTMPYSSQKTFQWLAGGCFARILREAQSGGDDGSGDQGCGGLGDLSHYGPLATAGGVLSLSAAGTATADPAQPGLRLLGEHLSAATEECDQIAQADGRIERPISLDEPRSEGEMATTFGIVARIAQTDGPTHARGEAGPISPPRSGDGAAGSLRLDSAYQGAVRQTHTSAGHFHAGRTSDAGHFHAGSIAMIHTACHGAGLSAPDGAQRASSSLDTTQFESHSPANEAKRRRCLKAQSLFDDSEGDGDDMLEDELDEERWRNQGLEDEPFLQEQLHHEDQPLPEPPQHNEMENRGPSVVPHQTSLGAALPHSSIATIARLHPSHSWSHHRGIVWCWKCGGYTASLSGTTCRARLLLSPCSGLPKPKGLSVLSRLRNGCTPEYKMKHWPEEEEPTGSGHMLDQDVSEFALHARQAQASQPQPGGVQKPAEVPFDVAARAYAGRVAAATDDVVQRARTKSPFKKFRDRTLTTSAAALQPAELAGNVPTIERIAKSEALVHIRANAARRDGGLESEAAGVQRHEETCQPKRDRTSMHASTTAAEEEEVPPKRQRKILLAASRSEGRG
jgi:hypothetical protein